MKNITFALLCCSAFLVACDNSGNTDGGKGSSLLDKARSQGSETTDSLVESAKESASSAMGAAKEAATEAISSGKELKETAVESAGAAVESVKETVSATIKKTETVVAAVTGTGSGEGESIYKKHCVACHGTGAAGSPKLEDKAAWGSRITQGNAVLTQHAIEGYKGKTGYMPPKGGFMSLSDEAISSAVVYMVSQVK